MFKKISKALEELAKNEELMAEIQAAAMDDISGVEGVGGGQIEQDDKERLRTIGEDGDEEKQQETKQDNRKGAGVEQQEYDDYENDQYDDGEGGN